MNNAAAFVLGLLIGWMVEWVVDWFYWRRRVRAGIEENAGLAKENEALVKENKNLDEGNTELKQRIVSLQAEIGRLSASATSTHLIDTDGNHNLQAIKGIGPTFSKRLNEAGVHTFERLSQLTPQEMEEILGTLFKRFFSKENTILAQAKEFAEQIARLGQ